MNFWEKRFCYFFVFLFSTDMLSSVQLQKKSSKKRLIINYNAIQGYQLTAPFKCF